MDIYTHTKKIEFDINTNIDSVLVHVELTQYCDLDSTQGYIKCKSISIVNNTNSPLTLTDTIYCHLYLTDANAQGEYTDLSEDNPLVINSNTDYRIDYDNTLYDYLEPDITFDSTGNCDINFRIILNTSSLIKVDYMSKLSLTNLPDLYGATELTDEDKKALQSNTAAIKNRLIIKATEDKEELVLTEDNSVKEWTYTNDRYVSEIGFLGQFVARTLEGELQDVSEDFNIEDRDIELQIGIVRLGSRYQYLSTESGDIIVTENGDYILASDLGEDITTWYSLGTFTVSKPEGDDVSDNTSFEALDKTILFNDSFDTKYTNDTFAKSFADTIADGGTFTVLQLAQYTCSQVGIRLGNTDFINNDFIITTNQFTEDYSCRDIMKSIAQLAFGYCEIRWDDKCYITTLDTSKDNIDEYATLDNDQYFTLTSQKNNYGPVNRVLMGLESVDDVEGGSTSAFIQDDESIAINGASEIDIYDNIIAYTQELREKAITKGTILYGIEFSPINTETIGHFYLPANKLCKIIDMENNVKYTYPFNMEMKYSGHIRTTIDSLVETKTQKTKAYSKKLYKDIKNLKIELDRQEGVISIVNSNMTALDNGLSSLETKVEQTYTDTYSKTEIQEIVNGIGVDGTVVTSVTTTAGTFDKNGLTIEQTDATTKTNLNANGMIIYDTTGSGEDELLVVDSNGVVGKNMTVKTYLTIGSHSRIEDYTHTDNTNGTGVFWIGDDY